ncbi:hypothetical protein BLOT_000129 [Blomia tropicalis]|nr:hypothetical protein BLOT_000129 [Blomia tropicalis]
MADTVTPNTDESLHANEDQNERDDDRQHQSTSENKAEKFKPSFNVDQPNHGTPKHRGRSMSTSSPLMDRSLIGQSIQIEMKPITRNAKDTGDGDGGSEATPKTKPPPLKIMEFNTSAQSDPKTPLTPGPVIGRFQQETTNGG